LLIIVEDVNDNAPIFKPYQSSIQVREDSPPRVLTELEANDLDEGPYGQVILKCPIQKTKVTELFSAGGLLT